jgi:hypothetical protein
MDPRNVVYALFELEADPMESTVAARYGCAPNLPTAAVPPTACTAIDPAEFDDAELLAQSGLVTSGQMTHAQNVAFMTAYPLGTVLIELEYATREQLSELQQRALQQAQTVAAPAQKSWEPCPEGGKENAVRIGELLEGANLINNRELSIAVSLSYTDTRKIGQILVSSGFVSEDSLRLALDCQLAVARRELPAERATAVLKHCVQQGYSIPEGIFDLGYSHDPTIMVFM